MPRNTDLIKRLLIKHNQGNWVLHQAFFRRVPVRFGMQIANVKQRQILRACGQNLGEYFQGPVPTGFAVRKHRTKMRELNSLYQISQKSFGCFGRQKR